MLDEVYGVKLGDLIPGIEKKIGSKLLGVRGSVDLVFSGVIIELKLDLEKEWVSANAELIKYFQCAMEEKPNDKYVAIATDLVRYRAFIPKFENNLVTDIIEIGSINSTTSTPVELIYWFDSFLFSQGNQPPTADDLKIKFGAGSPTYALTTQAFQRMWKVIVNDPESALKMNLWKRNMQIVYGREPEEEVFVDHTYIVTLVKLIVYLRLSNVKVTSENEIEKALNGNYFSQYGIRNLIEEDFFTWILDPKIIKETRTLAKKISQGLLKYDLSKVDEDLFKEIYQQIVRQGERHRVGEYYTPEWLCQLTTDYAIKSWSRNHSGVPNILDPACGSGTFITSSIHYITRILKENSGNERELLETILNKVMGLDVNPLAVTIARANYIIALGTLVQYSKNITIPIYNADSIKIPVATRTMFGSIPVYDLEINGNHIQLPEKVSNDRSKLDIVVSGLREALISYGLRYNKSESTKVFTRAISSFFNKEEISVLNLTLHTLMKLEDSHQDSIWVFIINNLYAPLFMKERQFDMLLSNPPWIVMRSIDNKSYQEFLKKQVFDYNLLKSKQIKLFTQMEMATLFFCRTIDLYLKDDGKVSFLMPISVIGSAEQHIDFQKFKKPSIKLEEILNFENVSEIFSLPVCVLIGTKGGRTSWPITMEVYEGKINAHNRNAKLTQVQLTSSSVKYSPPKIPKKAQYSDYYNEVKVGASIFPRNFWFIEFVLHPTLRLIDSTKPMLKTSEKAAEVSKKEWKDINIQGNVESDYIYSTLLGKDTIPFGHLKMRPIVLPIKYQAHGIRILSQSQVVANGTPDFARWFESAQTIWAERRTEKSEGSFPNVEDRLNYQNTLSEQDPSKRFIVLYNARGADSLTCVVDRDNIADFQIDHSNIKSKGFVADYTTYIYDTKDENEAHYLCAFLNSKIIHKRVKSFQPRGKYGKRDIGRRVFQLSIPRFSKSEANHIKLADLSKQCHSKIQMHNFSKKGFRGMRNEASVLLQKELEVIDSIVSLII